MPIIASTDGCVSEFIKKYNLGFCSSSNNINQFSNNLKSFQKLTFEQRRSFAINSYELYEKKFSKKIITKKLSELIYEKDNY